jgi:hypothetical protein
MSPTGQNRVHQAPLDSSENAGALRTEQWTQHERAFEKWWTRR